VAEEKKPVTAKVKHSTILSRVFKRGKDAKGKSYAKSTRGWKIRERAGDKKTTNKKGDEVTIRKSGNRVVKKRDAQGNVVRVVRKKADGTRVITENRMTPKPRVTGNRRAPNRKSPASTMATTGSKYSGGIASDDTRSGSENYRYRRYNQPALTSKKQGKPGKPRGGTR